MWPINLSGPMFCRGNRYFFNGMRVVGPLLAFPQVQRHDGCATRMALAVDLSARGQRLTFLKAKS